MASSVFCVTRHSKTMETRDFESKEVPTDSQQENVESAPERDATSGSDLQTVYNLLHQDILNGNIAPGEIINQVHIARHYGVSRTPVREALRMLQAEGLVEAQFQYRMRVTAITPDEVDAIYAMWIMMQSLGVALTVQRLNKDELSQIESALSAMDVCAGQSSDHDDWDSAHVDFHRRLVMHAGSIINASIENCWSRSERARRAYMRAAPKAWLDSKIEHRDIVNAYVEGSVSRAVHSTGLHLARIALMVIGNIDPSYEPRAVRQALNLSTAPDLKGVELWKNGTEKETTSRRKHPRSSSKQSGT